MQLLQANLYPFTGRICFLADMHLFLLGNAISFMLIPNLILFFPL